MRMDSAGRPTISQLRQSIDLSEQDQKRRNRLFAHFGEPRAAVI